MDQPFPTFPFQEEALFLDKNWHPGIFGGPFKLSNRKDIQKPRNLIFCLFFGVEAGWLSFYSDASRSGKGWP